MFLFCYKQQTTYERSIQQKLIQQWYIIHTSVIHESKYVKMTILPNFYFVINTFIIVSFCRYSNNVLNTQY